MTYHVASISRDLKMTPLDRWIDGKHSLVDHKGNVVAWFSDKATADQVADLMNSAPGGSPGQFV